jgi:hypothetical protein
MMIVTNDHEESPFRMCREHERYFVEGLGEHANHESYPLQWAEVVYYLNKLRIVRESFAKFRNEISI